MAWSGFSEDQIRKMKETPEENTSMRASKGQKNTSKRGRPLGNRGRAPPTIKKITNQSGKPLLPESQRLTLPSRPESEAWEEIQSPTKKNNHNGDTKREVEPPSTLHKEMVDQPVVQETENGLLEREAALKELDEEVGKQRELTKLQQLQEQQKEMEEDNKKKKALLFKALENRKKKTQEESKRLAFVQKELSKIENLLTNDVSILRDKIEEASRNYSDAEKRYQTAEKEFVAAKIYVHKMEEKKEALTEHLFTIIHENELRKAKKLEELVSSLDTNDMSALMVDTQGSDAVPSKSEDVHPTESDEREGSKVPDTTSHKISADSLQTSSRTDEVSPSNIESVTVNKETEEISPEGKSEISVTGQVERSPSIAEKPESEQLEASNLIASDS